MLNGAMKNNENWTLSLIYNARTLWTGCEKRTCLGKRGQLETLM